MSGNSDKTPPGQAKKYSEIDVDQTATGGDGTGTGGAGGSANGGAGGNATAQQTVAVLVEDNEFTFTFEKNALKHNDGDIYLTGVNVSPTNTAEGGDGGDGGTGGDGGNGTGTGGDATNNIFTFVAYEDKKDDGGHKETDVSVDQTATGGDGTGTGGAGGSANGGAGGSATAQQTVIVEATDNTFDFTFEKNALKHNDGDIYLTGVNVSPTNTATGGDGGDGGTGGDGGNGTGTGGDATNNLLTFASFDVWG